MSEMDFEARARMAAQRAEREVAMVDIPEADAVVGRRRAHHRTRNAVAGAAAVVILGGGVAFAVANASSSPKSESAHQPTTTTTTTVQQTATGPQLPANVLVWLKHYAANLPAQNHADYADWVLTTRQKAMAATNGGGTSENQRVYLFDVHGEFVWNHSCPANGPQCVSTGNDEIFTVDAATLQTLDFTVGDPVDLSKLGPVGRVILGRAELQFRPVLKAALYSAAACGQIGLIGLNEPGAFRDSTKTTCDTLGPTILNGYGIVKAEAVADPQNGSWQVNVTFGNDDFLNKVAKPYVGKQVAIVLDGVVYSAPTINPGITGHNVTISGQFTEQQAKNLATALAAPIPIISSPPSVPTTTTTTIAPVGSDAPWTSPTLVITPTSLGAVKLGMTNAQAEAAAGQIFNGSGDGYEYPTALPAGSAHDFVGIGPGEKVTCVGAADWSSATKQGLTQHVVTPEGVKLDDTVRHLLAVYPNATYIPAPPAGMTTDAGYVVRQPTGDLAFSVFQGQVRKISGGPHGQTPNSCTG